MQYAWKLHPTDPKLAEHLAEVKNIHPITAQLLLNRGVRTQQEVDTFLNPSISNSFDPYELPDMDLAVNRLKSAIDQNDLIVIFGDSDVDGLTASTILYEAIHWLGGKVSVKLSNRLKDGYGISSSTVSSICESAVKLVILVDCGTNQPDAVNDLNEEGIDTIIVDHHVPMDGWAKSHALVNPFSNGGVGRELCSAGLSFKFVQALFDGKDNEKLLDFLDLAALGTLADYSPLIKDSRLIVTEGIERIVNSHRVGLRKLCETTKTLKATPEHILRRLTPRLNSCGRLGTPRPIWNLLCEDIKDTKGKVEENLAESEQAHAQTKQLHKRTLMQAQELAGRIHFGDQYVKVLELGDQ